MSITIYGIKACDTMKKARAWLDDHGVAYAFHDYKAAGIDRASLERWAGQVGWDVLLNRSGTTFRKLAEADFFLNISGVMSTFVRSMYSMPSCSLRVSISCFSVI